MLTSRLPILMAGGLPKQGLVCWHDLYDPTSSLASVPDLSGNGYSLQLGSDAGADTNDPSWGADGKGLVFTTDDYCLTDVMPLADLSKEITVLVVVGAQGGYTSAGDYEASLVADADNQFWLGHVSYSRFDTGGKLGGVGIVSTTDGPSAVGVSTQVRVYGVTLSMGRVHAFRVSQNVVRSSVTGTSVGAGSARLGLGCLAVASPANIVDKAKLWGDLVYCRALGTSELTRAYRYLQSLWATRGVTVL